MAAVASSESLKLCSIWSITAACWARCGVTTPTPSLNRSTSLNGADVPDVSGSRRLRSRTTSEATSWASSSFRWLLNRSGWTTAVSGSSGLRIAPSPSLQPRAAGHPGGAVRRIGFASRIRRLGYSVDSSGRRNTAYVSCLEELVQSLGRCSPAQGLSRSAVEGDRHGRKVLGAVHAEVSALREVLPQQPVGVLVRATLPGAVRVAEVARHARLDPQLGMLGHFRSLIPGQRSSQL